MKKRRHKKNVAIIYEQFHGQSNNKKSINPLSLFKLKKRSKTSKKLSPTERKIPMSATSRCQYIQDLNFKFSFKLCGKPFKPMNSFYFILDVVKQ